MDYENMKSDNEENGTSGLAIASMVLGIVSIFTFCFVVISIICAVVGFVLGCVALGSNKKGKGMAIAGIVTSLVSVILLIVLVIIYGTSNDVADNMLYAAMIMF